MEKTKFSLSDASDLIESFTNDKLQTVVKHLEKNGTSKKADLTVLGINENTLYNTIKNGLQLGVISKVSRGLYRANDAHISYLRNLMQGFGRNYESQKKAAHAVRSGRSNVLTVLISEGLLNASEIHRKLVETFPNFAYNSTQNLFNHLSILSDAGLIRQHTNMKYKATAKAEKILFQFED